MTEYAGLKRSKALILSGVKLRVVICVVACCFSFAIARVGAAGESRADGSVPSPLSLEELLRAQSSAEQSVWSLDIELHVSVPGTDATEKTLTQWRWSRNKTRERIRFQFLPGSGVREGERRIEDRYQQDGEIRLLKNWDPAHPDLLTPLDQQSVSGSIVPATSDSKALYQVPVVGLLRELRFNFDPELRRSLSELAADSPNVQSLGKVVIDGRELWGLQIDHPNIGQQPEHDGYFQVFLDPEFNFNIRRVVEHYNRYRWHSTDISVPKFVQADVVRQVEEYRDLGNGCFLPIETRATFQTEEMSSPISAGRIIVTKLAVNDEVAEEAFDFRFPENLLVRWMPPVDGKVRVSLWGADNLPAQEIRGIKDLEVIAMKMALPGGWFASNSQFLAFIAVNAVFVVVAIATYLRRRRRVVGVISRRT